MVRWSVSLAGVAGLTASIYHFALPARQKRRHSLPGAVVATAMWFVSTLAFGWYVTRFANYNAVYGPLGAGIALLFWLYLVSLSVLCGAEFNAQFFKAGQRDDSIASGQTIDGTPGEVKPADAARG